MKGFCYFPTTEANGLSTAPAQKAPGIPTARQPVRRYPPLASLSSFHLLIKELLVLEWGEKKTQMQKHGSHLVNVYFTPGVSPWIFAYTHFGNEARWKERPGRKIDHKRKASGCTVFNKVLCNAPRHTSVINNHINKKIRHSNTQGALETHLLTLNRLCLKQTILSYFTLVSNFLFMSCTHKSFSRVGSDY